MNPVVLSLLFFVDSNVYSKLHIYFLESQQNVICFAVVMHIFPGEIEKILLKNNIDNERGDKT